MNPGTGIRRIEKLGFAPFFLAATLSAASAVPVWMVLYLGRGGAWAGGLSPHWHGHEMVFGYALAVIGGYLLTKVSWRILALLVAAWTAGRLAGLAGDALPAWLSAGAALIFPAALGYYAGGPFLRAAKRLRSAVPGLVIAAFLVAEVLFQAGALGLMPDGERMGLALGLDLITLMLFLMGGRVTAAATSGAIQARGRYLPGIAQSDLELAGLFLLLVMTAVDLSGRASLLAGALAVAAAGVIVMRLVRWQVWTVIDALDISSLHLGYALLALGLALKGFAEASGLLATFDASHGITVGALGVLSLTIMGRVTTQRTSGLRALPGAVRVAIALVALAALARLLALAGTTRIEMLVAASAAWSAGMMLFAVYVARASIAWWHTQRAG